MKHILKYILPLCFIALLYSCSSESNEPNIPRSPAKRTILVYMVASNTLGDANCDEKDLAEMRTGIMKSGLNNCRWLVFQKIRNHYPVLFEYSEKNGSVNTDTLKRYSNDFKTTDTRVMKEVLADVKSLSPASEYGLVLWSHATGWARTLSLRKLNPKSKYKLHDFGEDSGSTMPIDSVANSIPDGMFEFIYADACYMGTIEVAYEFRNKTHFYVASPAEVPIDGMPYNDNLPCFVANNLPLAKACENTYNYYNNQSGSNRTTTLSLIDCTKIEPIANLCKSILANGNTVQSYNSIQRYKLYTPYLFFDFKQYFDLLATPEQSTQLNTLLSQAVLYKVATQFIFGTLYIDPAHYSGLSTYILGTAGPTNENYYKTLSWYKDVYPNQ